MRNYSDFNAIVLCPGLQHEASCPLSLPGAFFFVSVSLELALWEMFPAMTELYLQLQL